MISVYIHIPFCNEICSYCDFSKVYYDESWIMPYLESLEKEIKGRYKGEKIRTLYIGGGTPSVLSIKEIVKLFEIIKMFDLSKLEEFTIECNVESLDKEKLILFKKNGVNRLSLGIQTFNPKYLELLNRKHSILQLHEMLDFSKHLGINNINMDLIYAIPGQTIEELKEDIDKMLRINPNHISCYSLMIEPNTKLYIDNTKEIDEDIDYEMYKLIEESFINHGYKHYEISNYSKPNYKSKHNLVYWNNEEYYGFGLSASSYINNTRIDNIRNLNKYINKEYLSNEENVAINQKIKYEFILGFRKMEGINKNLFYDKYKINIKEIDTIKKLLKDNKLIENEEYIYINEEWIYKSNEILMEFV